MSTHMPRDNPRLKLNNFDLLRLLLAMIVCLVHSAELSTQPSLKFISQILSSKIAVEGFFVISGFLIFMSYEKSSSLLSYTQKRIKRIYPAYLTIILLCAFSFFPFSTANLSEYFSSAWLKYLASNLSFMNFLHPNLPGVFENNSLDAVNGALWTIKIEVMFYCAVPIISYLMRRLGQLPVLSALYLLSSAYSALFLHLAASGNHAEMTGFLERQLPGQLRFFIAGALIYYYLDFFEAHIKSLTIAAATLLFVNYALPLSFLEPLGIACITIFFALYSYAGNFGKYGDFSYGVYITHFPIIQLLTQLGLFKLSPLIGISTTVALTVISAISMWHFVEKRFLLRDNHYIAVQRDTEIKHQQQAEAPQNR
jgi:peptidoglycan/LPS O-acetylase OafA/YrhL